MTSATGNHRAGAIRHRLLPARGRRGFTMVEVMVVVAILSLLFSIVLVATAGYRKRAAVGATKALIQRLELYLQQYKNLTGAYPPDGFDGEVLNDQSVPIKGSACLHHFLTKEIEVKQNIAGEERVSRREPVGQFKSGELAEDPDNPGVFEILDAFGAPIHYDNTANERFEPQTGDAHMPRVVTHPADPRESVDSKAVKKEGIQRVGYDIWSHGAKGHRDESDLSGTIATWNLGTAGEADDKSDSN
jgi:prepilin-type N-terminal cleavage/methylation domain-containing protein